jgi:hypothetical protein
MSGLYFIAILLLIAACLAVASQNVTTMADALKEGFQSMAPKPMVVPTPGPPPQPIGQGEKAQPYAPPSAEILGAPFGQTSEVSSRPYKDPATETAGFARLNELLQDLNAFSDFEVEKLQGTSDPAISLPLVNLQADKQRVSDEVVFMNRNPGLPSSLTLPEVQGIQVNLRFLQKKAREMSTGTIEGFADATVSPKATADEIQAAILKTTGELIRLQSSGTTDPLVQARISTLTQINQSLKDIQKKLQELTLLPDDVPITRADLAAYLPASSDASKPLSLFLSTLSTGSDAPVDDADVINAIMRAYERREERYNQTHTPSAPTPPPPSASQSRGEFELGTLPSGRPTFPEPKTAKFDWKARSSQICGAVRKRDLDPADFGCLADTSKVGQDFSWRGYTKMICTRLQTTMDEALPETCGCPPVNWKGWRQ